MKESLGLNNYSISNFRKGIIMLLFQIAEINLKLQKLPIMRKFGLIQSIP